MILTDTGPLVALVDRNDGNHKVCTDAAKTLPRVPLLSTWPCLTETMYFLGKTGGFIGQNKLGKLRTSGQLVLHELTPQETDRVAVLMEKYQDRPMDLADASLIAVAETRSLKQVFTLDTDFRFYRLADGSVLDVIPK